MRLIMFLAIALISSGATAQPLPDEPNGIKTLTVEQAEALAKRDGRLLLPGLTSLSDNAAEALAKHKGERRPKRLSPAARLRTPRRRARS